MDNVFQERISRRTLFKVGGGLLLASIVDFRLPGWDAVAMTRMQWVERDVFPATGVYQSPVFTADQPYNSIELSWIADQPPGSELRFSTRAKVDGSGWTDWISLHRDSHGRSVSDANRAYAAPVLVASSSEVQYQVELVPNSLGESPKLTEVEIGCVDTSPPAQYMAAGANLIDGWIIPRAGWGANESLRFKNGEEIWTPEYQPVQKVIVHHTVTQNQEADPAATVRAIYYYHAVTQGWGDIGYNFLIDWHGNVYEGRYGGRDVAAGHALQYNHGSLGVAVLGTFSGVDAQQSSLDSLVRVIKSRAANVDAAGIGYFIDKPNLANVCGHRDVLMTDCPGDHLYAKLPDIRGWVKGTGPITASGQMGPTRAEITSVTFTPSTVAIGFPLRIDIVVRNTGSNTLYTQGPPPGFAYLEGQDFDSAGFPKLDGMYRVGIDFAGNSGMATPFRWGLPGPLAPGESCTVTGYLRLGTARSWDFKASLVQEYVAYQQQGVFPHRVTVGSPPTLAASPSGDPSMHYFKETQHNVPDVFYSYWTKNGALFRFGYPLTEPFPELSATDGGIYLTQYFERARFEHHPENQPPYDVLLGLLARETTRGRENDASFRPVSQPPSSPDYDYFSETGHTLRGGFRAYWQAQGGLPSFGYPISEEFQEKIATDGKRYVVQYFERVRFEWHPENQSPYDVLIGHLAREMLIDRGWLKAGT